MEHKQPPGRGVEPSATRERSLLIASGDGQRLTIETPQSKGAGLGLLLLAVGCLVVGISELRKPEPIVVSEFFPPDDGSSAAVLFLAAAVFVCLAAYFWYVYPKVVTVLDLVNRTATVTRSHFGRQQQHPVHIALDAISDTRLRGTANRFESTAKIVADIDGIETDLTGESGTDFADEAQKAVREFLELG